MRFEIIKVANGYVVKPPQDISRMESVFHGDVRVFKTWGQASWWLDRQFKGIKDSESVKA